MKNKKDFPMTMIARFVLMLGLAVFPAQAQTAGPEEISWKSLAPPMAQIENPFASLTAEQMDSLRQILGLESRAKRDNDPIARADAAALRLKLADEGLDVDGLFNARLEIMKKRNAAASAVNDALIGKTVRLPGYVLPLEFKDKKVVEFLLVPTVGACIHTPPPPANQIVHIVYPDGIEVNGLFTPVWITGTMAAERSEQNVGFSDGRARVSVSYTMRPDLVQKYGK